MQQFDRRSDTSCPWSTIDSCVIAHWPPHRDNGDRYRTIRTHEEYLSLDQSNKYTREQGTRMTPAVFAVTANGEGVVDDTDRH